MSLFTSSSSFVIPPQYGFVGRWFSPGRPTVGALDFGGASTQITFATQEDVEDEDDMMKLRLYGHEYSLYTHSFLCYGQDQMLKRLLAHIVKVVEELRCCVLRLLCSIYFIRMGSRLLFSGSRLMFHILIHRNKCMITPVLSLLLSVSGSLLVRHSPLLPCRPQYDSKAEHYIQLSVYCEVQTQFLRPSGFSDHTRQRAL